MFIYVMLRMINVALRKWCDEGLVGNHFGENIVHIGQHGRCGRGDKIRRSLQG